MPVSEHDKRYMEKLAEASAELDKEELPPLSEADRAWLLAWSNERRVQRGLPPFEEEADEPTTRSGRGRAAS